MEDLDMDAFLREGGMEEDQKKIKKAEAAAAEGILDTEPVNEVIDVEPDEAMSGYMSMEKTKIDKGNAGGGFSVSGIAGGLVSGVGDIASFGLKNIKVLNQQKFFAIKKGILYMYEKANSREAFDKIPI